MAFEFLKTHSGEFLACLVLSHFKGPFLNPAYSLRMASNLINRCRGRANTNYTLIALERIDRFCQHVIKKRISLAFLFAASELMHYHALT